MSPSYSEAIPPSSTYRRKPPSTLGAKLGDSTMRMRTASKGVIAKHVKKVAAAPASRTSGVRLPSTATAVRLRLPQRAASTGVGGVFGLQRKFSHSS